MEALAAAALIRDWAAARDEATAAAELPAVGCHHPLLLAADVLACAADADDEATAKTGLAALFAGMVEPLNDGFRPAGRVVYARCFGRVLWQVAQRHADLAVGLERHGIRSEHDLLARHTGLRNPHRHITLPDEPRRIAVLSRVTLGADVALTSVLLQHLSQRWPNAELLLVGDGKLQGLLGGMHGLRIVPLAYARRGALRERLRTWLALSMALHAESPELLIGPDSRLDQLGLLPLLPAQSTLLWEGLHWDGQPPQRLSALLDQWCHARFSTATRAPSLSCDANTTALAERLRLAFGAGPLLAVKLDHGGNPAKALPRSSEVAVLRRCREQGWRILLDRGFGAAELAGSDALMQELGWQPLDLDGSGQGLGQPLEQLGPGELAAAPVLRCHGSIAQWAAGLAACSAALSYDSVGHHLAAALGVPLVTAFTGHADPGFAVAWRPAGPGHIAVVEIPTARKEAPHWVEQIATELAALRPGTNT